MDAKSFDGHWGGIESVRVIFRNTVFIVIIKSRDYMFYMEIFRDNCISIETFTGRGSRRVPSSWTSRLAIAFAKADAFVLLVSHQTVLAEATLDVFLEREMEVGTELVRR